MDLNEMRTEQKSKKRWFHRKPKQGRTKTTPPVEAVDLRLEALLAEEERIEREAREAHSASAAFIAKGPGRPVGTPNLTPDDPRVLERLDLWRQGLSAEAVAGRLGISDGSVRNTVSKFATDWDRSVRGRNIALRRAGRAIAAEADTKPRRGPRNMPHLEWYAEAIDAWAAGSTLQVVADAFGVSRERIRQVVNRFATDEQRAERERSLLAIRYLLDLKIEEKQQVEALERKRAAAQKRAAKAKRNDLDLRVALINWCLAWRAAHPGEEGSISSIMRWARETAPHKDHPRMQTTAGIYFSLGRWGYEYPNEFLTFIGVPNNGQVERIDALPETTCRRAVDAFIAGGGRTVREYDEWRKLQEPKAPSRAVIEKHLCDRMGALIRNALEELDLKSDEEG